METKELGLIEDASIFAQKAHRLQRRKYNQTPYILHPARVAALAHKHIDNVTEEIIAAAWLHDVVEDTSVTIEEIELRFGPKVAGYVGELTNASKGSELPRETRKQMDREKLEGVSNEAKQLKMLDRIDNLSELDGAPIRFRKLYVQETEQLAEVIGDANEDMAEWMLEIAQQLSHL